MDLGKTDVSLFASGTNIKVGRKTLHMITAFIKQRPLCSCKTFGFKRNFSIFFGPFKWGL